MAALLFYQRLRTEGPVLSVLRLRYRYTQNEREYEAEGPVLTPCPSDSLSRGVPGHSNTFPLLSSLYVFRHFLRQAQDRR